MTTRSWTRPPFAHLVVEALEDRSLPSGTLYFSQAGNPTGLYTLDQGTGAATRVGAGITMAAGSPAVGLTQSPFQGELYGSAPDGLVRIKADGSGAVATGNLIIEGLATSAGALYGTNDTAFFTINPKTGTVFTALPTAPADIEGLSDGPSGVLYGLSSTGGLYTYDINQETWSSVGSTGLALDNADLAYDPGTQTLYAKSSLNTNLYKIDPTTAAATVVGNTALAGGGGLAFVADEKYAGVVTVMLSPAGKLTLTGDARDNGIGIALNEPGVGTTIVGLGGTKLNLSGVIQDSFVFQPTINSLATSLKDGADTVLLHPSVDFALAGSAAFDLGSGDNSLRLTTAGDITVGGNLTVAAQDGDDDVILIPLAPATATVNGNVSVNLGAGTGILSVFNLTVHGTGGFRYASGAGNDVAVLTSMTVDRGGVQMLVGDGTFVGAVVLSTVKGVVRVASTGILQQFSLGGNDLGGLDVSGANYLTGTLIFGQLPTTVRGNLIFRAGVAQLSGSTPVTVGGSLTVTGGQSANVNVTDLTVGQSMTVAGPQACLVTAPDLTVGGPLTATSGVVCMITSTDLAVGGAVTVRADAITFQVSGGSLTAGSLALTAGSLALVQLVDNVVDVAGNVQVSAGGQVTTSVSNPTGTLTVGGSWTVISGVGGVIGFAGATPGSQRVKGNIVLKGGRMVNGLLVGNSLQVDGSVMLDVGNGESQVSMGSTSAQPMLVGKNLSITTRNGNDLISLTGVKVGGRTTIHTGGGRDTVEIRDGTEVVGPTTIDLGTGDDTIQVAANPADPTSVLFGGPTAIRTGAGNDTAQIGFLLAAGGGLNSFVAFNVAGNVLDLGTGINTYDTTTFAVTGQAFGLLTVKSDGQPPVLLP